jgi:hypothetical protein
VEAGNPYSHSAFFNQMKQVLGHTLGPHYPCIANDRFIINQQLYPQNRIGLTDVGGFDEHTHRGKILSEGPPASLCICTKTNGNPSAFSVCVSFISHEIVTPDKGNETSIPQYLKTASLPTELPPRRGEYR